MADVFRQEMTTFGNRVAAGYLGKGDQFDEAVADFATAYARQNENDYKALVRAARQGRIEVQTVD
jgi:hypothetical protein